MNELERIERIVANPELLASLDSSDLVAAGYEAKVMSERWRNVERRLETAIRQEAETEGAAIIIGGHVDAEIVQSPGAYKCNAEALDTLVRPLLGDTAFASVAEEVPHVCPPKTYKVNAVKLRGLLTKLGPKGAGVFERCVTREMGPPKVKYIEREVA